MFPQCLLSKPLHIQLKQTIRNPGIRLTIWGRWGGEGEMINTSPTWLSQRHRGYSEKDAKSVQANI